MTCDLTAQFNEANLLEKCILLGQESGSIVGLQDRGPATAKADSKHREAQKSKNRKAAELLRTLNDIRTYIERLEQEIDAMEAMFRERDGDAWREKLALKILDADDIPQRRTDESMEDYRERLEPLLMAEMLNPDGSIKAQYENDPELNDYAQWAQKQNNLNTARDFVRELEDPNTSPQRTAEIEQELKQRANTEESTYADREATAGSDTQSRIKGIADEVEDTSLNTASNLEARTDLFKPIGMG